MSTNKSFADRLQSALDYRNKRQIDLTIDAGMNKSLISQYLSGKFEAKNDKIDVIAEYLDIDPLYLMGKVNEFGNYSSNNPHNLQASSSQSSHRSDMEIISSNVYLNIPLYQSISCGNGMFVEDNIEEYIQISDRLLSLDKKYFAQIAHGDSMVDENIRTGDVLIFEKTTHIENGQVGCFCLDNNVVTCKKFYRDDLSNIIMLHPANPNYVPIVVTVESMEFHVVGKLKLVINKRE